MREYDKKLLPSNRFFRNRRLGAINAIKDGSPLDRGRKIPQASPRSTSITIRETDIKTLLDGSVIKADFYEFSRDVLQLAESKYKKKLLNRLIKVKRDEHADNLALELKSDITKIMSYLKNPTALGKDAAEIEKTLDLKHSITHVHKMPVTQEILVRRALFKCLNGRLQLRSKLKGKRADYIDADFYESSKRVGHLSSALNNMVNAMLLGGISIEYMDLTIKINTFYLDEFSTAINKVNDQIERDKTDRFRKEIRQELTLIELFKETITEQANIVHNLISKVDGLSANPANKVPRNIKEITIDLADIEQANENVQKGVGELVKGMTAKTVMAFTIRYARLFYRINGLRKFGDRILDPISSNRLYQRRYEVAIYIKKEYQFRINIRVSSRRDIHRQYKETYEYLKTIVKKNSRNDVNTITARELYMIGGECLRIYGMYLEVIQNEARNMTKNVAKLSEHELKSILSFLKDFEPFADKLVGTERQYDGAGRKNRFSDAMAILEYILNARETFTAELQHHMETKAVFKDSGLDDDA